MEQQSTNLKSKKKFGKWGIVTAVAIAILSVVSMGLMVSSLPATVEELALSNASETAEAILASAKVDSATVISVPVVYYDQEMDTCVNMYDIAQLDALKSRQFEWTKCGYYEKNIETGLVENDLDSDYLPIAVSGELLPNRGLSFARWFAGADGSGKLYTGSLSLGFDVEATSFEYGNEEFYPLNEMMTVDRGGVNKDGNNHLFTMNFGVPFRVLKSGEEEFKIAADDDTWIFVNDKLVLDMGGIHDVTEAEFRIRESGEIYTAVDGADLAYSGVTLDGDSAIVRVFHADRDSENSVFRIKFANMVLNITNASIAKRDAGVEVAYDPMDPSYVAPLGESIMVKPDKSRSLAIMIVVQIVGLGAFGVLLMMAISVAWRYLRRDHSREE